jgi:hypothetical protein
VASFAEHLPHDRITAFFEFIHREELERAGYAWSILRIIADPAFCRTLVTRDAWALARMLRDLAETRLRSRSLEEFLEQLGIQAVICDDSMVAREIEYHGFGAAPLLLDALFSEPFILDAYNPFGGLRFEVDAPLTSALLERFNRAAEKAYIAMIDSGSIWHVGSAHSIESFYEGVFQKVWLPRKKSDWDVNLRIEMNRAVGNAIDLADRLTATLSDQQVQSLYVKHPNEYRHDLLETLVMVVYNALAFISNHFEGYGDDFWFLAHEAISKSFPSIGEQPDGMSPFQQRLAIKLLKKLDDNLKGFYPSISRVLLSRIGPYQHKVEPKNQAAFIIFKNAMYERMRRLQELAAKDLAKVPDYLPDDVTYNFTANELTHSYRDGRRIVTSLNALKIEPVSLLSEGIRRQQQPAANGPSHEQLA